MRHPHTQGLGRDYKNKTFLAHTQKINPWFFTGFTNGEGSFIISITEDKKLKLGWKVGLFFCSIGGPSPPPLDKIKQIKTGINRVR